MEYARYHFRSGQTIIRLSAPDEESWADLIYRGVPQSRADLLVGLFQASRKGEFAAVDPTLEHLVGRPPISLHDILAAGVAQGHKPSSEPVDDAAL